MSNIKLLIVDDHPVVIDGIQMMLENTPDITVSATATNAEKAIEILRTTPIDVAIVDVNLPGMDGIELCKHIKNKWPKIQLLALTTFNEASIISGMMKSGASGYLLKNTSSNDLVEAVKTVHSGRQYLAKEVQEKLIASSIGQTKDNTYIPKLTRREKDVLKLIMEEYTTKEIAEKLCVSTATIETHRLHLLSKLNVRNTAGLVKVALTKGLG